MINKFIKYNEAKNPFAKIKNYGISNLSEEHPNLIEIPVMKYVPGRRLTLSQYKKYLNNVFVNKLIMIIHIKDEKPYLTYLRVKGLSIDKEGNITKFHDGRDSYSYLEEYNAFDVEKYVELLKSLEGQTITFTKYNPRIKIDGKYTGGESAIVNDFNLSKVYIGKHDYVFFVNEEDETYRVNIFRDIKKPRVFSIEDPYGEEDWDEEILESFMTWYMMPTRKRINPDELTDLMKKKNIDKLNQDFIGWVRIKPVRSDYLINVTRWEIGPRYNLILYYYEYIFSPDKEEWGGLRIKEYTEKKYNIRQPKLQTIIKYTKGEGEQIFTKEDPYGEEAWDVENKILRFKDMDA